MTSLMANTPFARTTFTFSVEGAQTGTDADGNPVFGSTTGTLSAIFAPYRFDQLRIQPGSDPKVIAGRGELVSPLTFPAGVGIGSVLTCEFGGQKCEATLTTVIPNDLPGFGFGTFFTADLRVVNDG